MTAITVHPDPQEPAGGYAFLELPEGSLSQEPVSVAIFDPFSERWLGGGDEEGGVWQTLRHDFGPFDIHRHEGAEWVRLGPEIVDLLLSDMPLRIEVDDVQSSLVWPEDVRPRARAAVLGALHPVTRQRPVADPAVPVPPPEPKSPPEPAPATETRMEPEVPEEAAPARSFRPWLWGVLLLVLAAAVLWYFLNRQDAGATQEAATGTTQEPVQDPCSLAALQATKGGFSAIEMAIRNCGADVSADTALHLIEEGAQSENSDALLLFGTLYDGAELDPRIENLIGLSFDDDPAQAAEYYARAARAGSDVAASRLEAVCKLLPETETTLARGAHDDFCQ